MGKRKQGIKVTIYLPEHLIDKWDSLTEKSKFVQEAIENATKNTKQ